MPEPDVIEAPKKQPPKTARRKLPSTTVYQRTSIYDESFSFPAGHIDIDIIGLRMHYTNKCRECTVHLFVENDAGKKETSEVAEGTFSIALLRPGENTVIIIVKGKDGSEIGRKTFAAIGKGALFKSSGIEFLLEGEGTGGYSKELLADMARNLATANSFLSPEFQIHLVLVVSGPRANAIAIKFWEADISIFSALLERDRLVIETAFWHETAHKFAKQLQKTKPDEWKKLEATYAELKKASVLFPWLTESQYMNVPLGWGHPYDSPEELFASASVVLRYFPNEFMKRFQELDAPKKELLLQAARLVVTYYLQLLNFPKDFFSPELLQFLGLQKKQPLAH